MQYMYIQVYNLPKKKKKYWRRKKNHDQVAHMKRPITTFAVRVYVKPFNAYLRLTMPEYSPINSP